MMKNNLSKYYYYCFILVIILLNACSPNQIETGIVRDGDIFVVDLDNTPKSATTKFSTLFRSAKFILLEDAQDALLAKINKIVVSDKYIFVLEKNRGLYLFDKEGKFVRTIGKRGGGPGEFLDLDDFSVDEVNHEIYLLDGQTQKVLKFSFDSKYLGSFRLPNDGNRSSFLHFHDNHLYTDLYYYENKEEGFTLRKMDTLGQNVSYNLPIKEYTKGWNETSYMEQEPFVSVGGESRFIQLFMDTIMKITPNGVSPYIALKSGKLVTKEDLKAGSSDPKVILHKMISFIGKDKLFNINNYFESDNHIYFEYDQRDKGFVLIDKKENNIKLFSDFLYDDILYSNKDEELLYARFKYMDEGGVYAVMMDTDYSRTQFLKMIRENSLNENLGQETLNQLKTLSEDSNPIIVYYEFAD